MSSRKINKYIEFCDEFARYTVFAKPGSKRMVISKHFNTNNFTQDYKIDNIFSKNNYEFIKDRETKRYFMREILFALRKSCRARNRKTMVAIAAAIMATSLTFVHEKEFNDSKIENNEPLLTKSSFDTDISDNKVTSEKGTNLIEEKLSETELYHGYSIKDVKDYDYLSVEQEFNTQTKQRLNNVEITENKSYMDAKYIDNKTSDQYRFLFGGESEAKENENGYYKLDDRYCVAMGSYFGPIGTCYDLYLEKDLGNGEKETYILPVIKSEAKADVDTIDGFEHNVDSSIIEFLINPENPYMKQYKVVAGDGKEYIHSGNFNNFTHFKGKIIDIKIVPIYKHIIEKESNFIPEERKQILYLSENFEIIKNKLKNQINNDLLNISGKFQENSQKYKPKKANTN